MTIEELLASEDIDTVYADFFRHNQNIIALTPRVYGEFRGRESVTQIGSGLFETRRDEMPQQEFPQPPVLAAPPPGDFSLVPPYGATPGGDAIQVVGTGFIDNADLKVIFIDADGNEVEQIIDSVDPDGQTIHIKTKSFSNDVDEVLVDVKVVTSVGDKTETDAFTYFIPLRIDVVDPNTGSTAGGDVVTIYGQGFRPFDLVVFFGANDVGGIAIAPDGKSAQIVSTPAHAAGSVDVTANSPRYSDNFVFPAGFTYGGANVILLYQWDVVGDGTNYFGGINLVSGAEYEVDMSALDVLVPRHVDTTYNGAPVMFLSSTNGCVVGTSPPFGSSVPFASGLATIFIQAILTAPPNPGSFTVRMVDAANDIDLSITCLVNV